MKKVKVLLCKFLVFAFVLSMAVSSDAAAAYAAENSGTESLDSKRTDIAQVFITVKDDIVKEDYVTASISILDKKGGSYPTIIDDAAKIKLRGNSTAYLDKHPYNIKFSTSQSVLGMPEGKKWCLLANYMDTSLMRDRLVYSFAEEIGLPYSCETRYADVWLNGEYNGDYLVTVPVETGPNRVDINTENNEYLLERDSMVEDGLTYLNTYIYRFQLNAPETLTTGQESWLFNYLVTAEAAMEKGDWATVKQYIDFNSFIDFYLVQELFKNMDFNVSSTRFYIKNNKLYAGPVWDCDLSCGNASSTFSSSYSIYNNYGEYGNGSGNSYEGLWTLKNQTNQNSWIEMLMKCDDFSGAFYERYMDLQDKIVNLYQDNALGKNQIDLTLQEFGKSFNRDVKRWPLNSDRGSLYRSDEKTYDASVAFLRSFLQNRNEWLLNELAIYKPSVPINTGTVGAATAVQTSAKVNVNGSDISFEAYNIGGNNYFKLRDLANAVSGTNKQFEVTWDSGKGAINLISNTSYTVVGGEMQKGDGRAKQYSQSTSKIYKDGQEVNLTAYLINGNNYFKLRDVAQLFNIGVSWDQAANTIVVDTNAAYMQ